MTGNIACWLILTGTRHPGDCGIISDFQLFFIWKDRVLDTIEEGTFD